MNNQRRAHETYWKERSLFYLGRMYTADLESGEDYSLLEPCIHISILAFDLPEATRFYSTIRLMDVKTKQIYSYKLSLRVLYLNRLDQASKKERRTQVYRWAKLITAKDWEDLRRIAMEDEYKAEAVKEMERINADRELRYEYLSQEIARLDENTRRAEEHRNREKARQEGREQGREQERQLQLQKTEASARKLYKRGVSVEEIAEILDIPADQIVHWCI